MILALDLGTTYFKFSLIDGSGRLLHTERVVPQTSVTSPGRLELPVDRFIEALDDGIARILCATSQHAAAIRAITFATQANSFVLLDAHDRPLTPILLWPDTRGKSLEQRIAEQWSSTRSALTTGVPSLSCEFMVCKLCWITRHHHDVWRQTRRLCLLSDYLTLMMTGEHVTEAGVAALSGLVDVPACCWRPQSLDAFALPVTWLPRIVRAGTDVGPLHPKISARYGLSPSCRFVAGCLDQYAGAIGVGNVLPGMVSETTGTVLSAVSCADQFRADIQPGLFQGPAYRDHLFWRMAFGNVSANYLHWYRDQLEDRPTFAELSELAAAFTPGAGGLRMDRRAVTPAAALSVLVSQAPRGQIVRCIMESVADELGDHLTSLGTPSPSDIRSAGGGSHSSVWLQIKADLLGVPVRATCCQEPTSLGAAILAESTLSQSTVPDVASRWVQLQPAHDPNPAHHAIYRQWKQSRPSETISE